MSAETIKVKLHQLIDQLEDQQALQKLYSEALDFKYTLVEDDPFTEELWDEISEGLAQIRNDEPCTHDTAVNKFREWLRGSIP
ncbi:MAG: hypothetical protein H7Z13_07240 [Ferruginibacter sp.]|nr:hypothetical protein [Ferruginibacter sp.]